MGLGGLVKSDRRRFTQEASVQESVQQAGQAQAETRAEPIKGRMVSMEADYHSLVDELALVPRRFNAARSDVFRAGVLALSRMSDEQIEVLLKEVTQSPLNAVRSDERFKAIPTDK